MSSPIQLLRGLRQGCKPSLTLYVIHGEVTTININNNKNIKGVKIPNNKKEIKISQYADDSNLLLTEQESIKLVIKFFEKLSKATGSTTNLEKTKVLPINMDQISYIQKQETSIKILEQHQYIKILGIHFSEDLKDSSQLVKHFHKNGKSYTKTDDQTIFTIWEIYPNKYSHLSQNNFFK